MKRGEFNNGADTKSGAALFLQFLKNTTAPQHGLLESHPLLSAIVSPGVTIRQYGAYLVLMNRILTVYEKQILPVLAGQLLGFEQTKASLLIENDLEYIGFKLPDEASPGSYILPEEKLSIPFALGFQYVMEGSKLGGRVIYKNIQLNLAFSAHGGAGYLYGEGADTAVHWKNFLSAFAQFIIENEAEYEAVRGAAFAFSSVYDFFVSNRAAYDN